MIRSRPVAALLASQAISGLGSQMTFVALPWFVLVTSGSPSRMALVFAVEVLPVALFGVPSGSVVQRYGARTTMVVCDFVSAPLIALIPLLHALDALSFPVLLVIVFATGVFFTPYFSASRLLIPELVGEDQRAVSQGNSLVEGTTQLTGLVGPALAGVLIAWLGAANVLWLDACSFLVSFALLAAFVPSGKRVVPEAHERGVLAGVRFVVRDPLLRLVTFVACAVPLWALLFDIPPAAAVAAIFACAFFVPSLNAPVLGLFSLRSPPALRGKTMTALITANSLARPLSFAAAGPLLARAGLTATFFVAAAGLTVAAAVFVSGTSHLGATGVEEAA